MKIGEIIPAKRDITLNEGRQTIKASITNTGDRPIQVGSHYHFFETNRLLQFDRKATFGMRLDIPSGTSVRFEPGETKEVLLTEMGGKKCFMGLNNLTNGTNGVEYAMKQAREKGFVKEEA